MRTTLLMLGSLCAMTSCLTMDGAKNASMGAIGCYPAEMTMKKAPVYLSDKYPAWEVECGGTVYLCRAVGGVQCAPRLRASAGPDAHPGESVSATGW